MLACVSALVSCTGSLSRPLRCASLSSHRLTRGTIHWDSRFCTGSLDNHALGFASLHRLSRLVHGISIPLCHLHRPNMPYYAWQEMLNMIRKPVDHHTWAGVCTPAIPAGCPSLPVAQAPYLTDESTTPCFAQAHLRYERPWPKADFQNSHISGSLHRPIV